MNTLKNHLFLLSCIALFAFFDSSAQPTLQLSQAQCREMALACSEDLQIANNKQRQAEMDRQIAIAAALPNIEGSATGSYIFPDMNLMGMKLCMHGTYLAGLTLTQPIYTGGKLSAARQLAKIGAETSSEQQRMTTMDVLVDADRTYWSYVAVKRKIHVVECYCRQMDTLYRQAEVALRAGLSTSNDMLRIEAKRSELRYQLQRAQCGVELCRLALCRTIGVDYTTLIQATDTLINCSTTPTLDVDTDARPELRLLHKQIEVSRQQLRMSKAELLPTVGLSLGYTYYDRIQAKGSVDAGDGIQIPYTQNFSDGIGMAMIAIKVPIFHWGEARKKVGKARYELQNAELTLQKNSRLIDIEVQQAIFNVQTARQLIETAQLGIEQADENLRVMQNRYAARLSPLTDLLEAQTLWQQASSNLIEAQTQYKIYETEYLRATGRLE
jgi:outer membrane protein TolC